MAGEVVRYCFSTLSALVMNQSYGSAVTMDGMCITLPVPLILGIWVLTVTDVRHAVSVYASFHNRWPIQTIDFEKVKLL
jgi:hypothetical protein